MSETSEAPVPVAPYVNSIDLIAETADIRERAKKHEPGNFDLVANSIDGSHTHHVRIAPGTDCLLCNCGSALFVVMFAEFSDHSGGIIAQCQECGQIIEVQKD